MKRELKTKLYRKQNGMSALTQEVLPPDISLIDTHRKNPKRNGGIYTDENTILATPVEHMKKHGTLREREAELDQLKNLIDIREHAIRLRNKIGNQVLAWKRHTDSLDEDALIRFDKQYGDAAEWVKSIDKRIIKHLKTMEDPLIQSAFGIKGIGPITIAYCLVYIDLSKARHASSLWAYAGLDKPSYARYEKNVAGGGNKRLRTVLYTMADSQVKSRGPYREVYDLVKERLSVSEKIVVSRNTQGKKVEVPWKDTKPSHRHGAAMRAIMKHFLADYWYVGRTLAGMETNPLYPEAVLKSGHRTIMPEERGWKY